MVLRLENCDSISSFREGLAYFFRDGLYGYMDQSGKVVIPPAYDDAGYFYDGLASVRKGGFFGLVDKDGREVLAPQYSSIRREESYIIAEKEGIFYCIDGEGREFSLGAWDSVREEDGMLLVCRDDLYGLADGNGNLILEPVYEQIVPIAGKELAIVYNENGESGILDYAGQVRVPFIYSSIYEDGGGGLRVTDRDTGKIGYLDGENLTVSIPTVYDGMGAFTEGRAVVIQDGKYGVIRYDGTLELPLEYDDICLFSDGSMAVWTGETVRL
ncbi:MAG: WG repeat-containing protein, partial [Acetatifactor sp.]|nr:WG repeat-containing protein [Acetatifactor sp.]